MSDGISSTTPTATAITITTTATLVNEMGIFDDNMLMIDESTTMNDGYEGIDTQVSSHILTAMEEMIEAPNVSECRCGPRRVRGKRTTRRAGDVDNEC